MFRPSRFLLEPRAGLGGSDVAADAMVCACVLSHLIVVFSLFKFHIASTPPLPPPNTVHALFLSLFLFFLILPADW